MRHRLRVAGPHHELVVCPDHADINVRRLTQPFQQFRRFGRVELLARVGTFEQLQFLNFLRSEVRQPLVGVVVTLARIGTADAVLIATVPTTEAAKTSTETTKSSSKPADATDAAAPAAETAETAPTLDRQHPCRRCHRCRR